MKPMNPSGISNFTQVLNSFFKVLAGNVSFGNANTYDSAGTPATFNTDNTDGALVRVASSANPFGLPQYWSGSNTATVITHNLNRTPLGYLVVQKDATCDIYSANPMVCTNSTITLYNTAGTVDTTLYIF